MIGRARCAVVLLTGVTACGFPRPTDLARDASIPGDASPDAADDPIPDAREFCLGAAPFTICLLEPPTKPVLIRVLSTLDTGTSSSTGTDLTCSQTLRGGVDYCVVAATTITVTATFHATGSRPLVFFASEAITTMALVDVGSHRLPVESIGPGADPTTGCVTPTPPSMVNGTGGGGAGGSFTGFGGSGGSGGSTTGAQGGKGGIMADFVDAVTVLRGGCKGSDGAGGNKASGGHGGGALYLLAGTSIHTEASINAGGEGGDGGGTNSGGGGGGTGGMIRLDAPSITVDAALSANGGGGGEGGDNTAPGTGNQGSDANIFAAASGGNGGTVGGDGGNGFIALPGTPAQGLSGSTTQEGGGGGGGGGAGLILAPAGVDLGPFVSPAPTPY